MPSVTYVGLDVHSRSISVAVLPPECSAPSRVFEIVNEPKSVRRAFRRLSAEHGEIRCCYEAGPCGYVLQRQLAEMKIACDVIAPALIPTKPGDRIKTDRRDASKLVRLHRAGQLTAIRIPTPDEEAVRDLVRARDDVRKDLTAARNRLSKFLLRHGRVYSEGQKWTERFWRWLNLQRFERSAERLTLEHYVRQVEHLEARLGEISLEICKLSETPPYDERARRIECLRGFSTTRAMVVLTEVGDFRRFEHPRQLMGFVGLVPSEHSSGGRERRGRITKTGNAHLRRVLIQAAWAYRHPPAYGPRARHAIEGQPPGVVEVVRKAQRRLHHRYGRLISQGKRTQVAVTAIARELCGFLWALMKEGAT